MANRPSPYIPADPLFKDQWFLNNTGQIEGGRAGYDINVIKVWPDYTGNGVLVAAIDDGFDQTHPDLAANYRADLAWDLQFDRSGAEPVRPNDNHGTAVAGLVVGVQGNGVGGTGSAWGASLVGYRAQLSSDPAVMLAEFQAGVSRMLDDQVDVSTNSWGPMGVAFDNQAYQPEYVVAARQLAAEGRGGLGIATLFAAGNDRAYGFNANYDPTDNLPWAITVAASKADGQIAGYSTPGASVLVTAPGSDPASIVTTDRQSTPGYNNGEGTAGNYTDSGVFPNRYFNGTSAATPIAAGVVALMLEANPNLGYRDIQEILVYSSKRAVFLLQDGVNVTANQAHDWNGGGLVTGYDFGFGNIDALAAVRMAESWQKTSTISNLQILDGSVVTSHLIVEPGRSGVGVASFASDARVEQVTVTVDLETDRLQNVKLDLVSPNGTHSLLVDNPPPADTDGDVVTTLTKHLQYTLNTVRDWGESLQGEWTLNVINGFDGSTVTLNNWSIKAYAADSASPNAQIFTNELATFAAIDPNRLTLSSSHGVDLNASAVSGASVLDLSGGASSIGGISVTLTDPQAFKKIITGDGNDTLIGNTLDNLLMGGRGSNVMDGREGFDTAQFIGGRSMYDVIQNGVGGYQVTSGVLSGGGVDQLTYIEQMCFGTTTLVAKSALDQTQSVGSMYQAMFDRGADAGGLKYWTNSILDSANSELSVATAFTQSQEDDVVSLTNAQFVTRMYTDGLDRQPDQAGYDYWLTALNTQAVDRGQVLLSFIGSNEFVNDRLDMVAVQVANLGDIWV